jgi:hypothetical protein
MKHLHNRKYVIIFILGLLLLAMSPLNAGIPGYYFNEVVFDFSGADADKVISLDYDGNEVGNQANPYGPVIDPEGKLWFGFYSGFSNEIVKTPGDTIKLTGIRCFLPDGSEAEFSPLELLEFSDGSKDTLYTSNPYNGYCWGITLDADGNILYTARTTLYKINYTDGSAIAKWDPSIIAKPLRTHLSAIHDSVSGYIYFAPYPQYEQLHILDEDLNFVSAGLTLTSTLTNAIQVRTKSNGVTQLFTATHSNGQGIFVYESSDPATIPFSIVDTIGNYSEETDTNVITYRAWATSLDWIDKDEGILLFGNDPKAITTVNTGTPPVSPHAGRWVAIDVDTDELLYMFGAPWYDMILGEPHAKEVSQEAPNDYLENQVMVMRPSGAIFEDHGNYSEMILTDKGLNCVQQAMYSTSSSSDIFIPYSLKLDQNYPNPFNPLTCIQFYLDKSDVIVVDIRDLRGHLMLQLYSGYVEAGAHNIMMNANELASGTYIYTLHTTSLSVSRKMTVLK